MKERVSVLIDGSNFYFKLKDLGLQQALYTLNYSKFIEELVSRTSITQSTYYVGAVRNDGTRKKSIAHSYQQKLLTHLKRHGINYSLGYLLKVDNKTYEKGVDVQMATDILISAYENQADKIYLISSDTDLIPAIDQARKLRKHICYIGFTHFPSRTLMTRCTSYQLLDKKFLLRFLDNDQQTH